MRATYGPGLAAAGAAPATTSPLGYAIAAATRFDPRGLLRTTRERFWGEGDIFLFRRDPSHPELAGAFPFSRYGIDTHGEVALAGGVLRYLCPDGRPPGEIFLSVYAAAWHEPRRPSGVGGELRVEREVYCGPRRAPEAVPVTLRVAVPDPLDDPAAEDLLRQALSADYRTRLFAHTLPVDLAARAAGVL